MNVLALDLSTKSTGYAYFQNDSLVNYGCITAYSTDLINRISKVIQDLKENVFNQYEIDKIVVEEVRPENGMQNIKTHRALMWLQAAVAFLAHDVNKNIEIEYVYPSEWRKQCGIHTGRGIKREEIKQRDIDFVKIKYNLDVNDDIADAIGIGHGYVHNKMNERKSAF